MKNINLEVKTKEERDNLIKDLKGKIKELEKMEFKTPLVKYLKRILGLPFFLMLNIIGIFFHLCKISKAFILYGGEVMAYDKKTTPKMVADLYYKMVEIKDVNDWIEWKKSDLKKAKTKFQENDFKDWVEIPDYKIAILEELQRKFKLKL